MARKSAAPDNAKQQIELLKDAFIAFLLLHKIPQRNVRKVVRVDLTRVTKIASLLGAKNQRESGRP